MERYICIHGHFYQPPRENPWLEEVELQDSAYPYHDWNERICAQCYAPNAVSRILDSEQRIIQIVNNYSKISFNFGPTLLSWLERHRPDTYEAVLEADRMSMERFSGHGSALAQAYNHMILPLANSRDKITQVLWGIADFKSRFRREPEGMWLPETAVDVETLEILAQEGIRFTILAPGQGRRVRERDSRLSWQSVEDSRIDPSTSYLCELPSGRSICLFFYDGPISREIAFGGLLNSGEFLADRLMDAFADQRTWPQLVHVAVDGETFGHHQRMGDMALAYCLYVIELRNQVQLTNYGEFLEKHPPIHVVEIIENSSWSCVHGVERWREDCGCNSGMHLGWHQAWRRPLRESLDWLRDKAGEVFEELGSCFRKSPWEARDGAISLILNRSRENVDRWLSEHAVEGLTPADKIKVLQLIEMQRNALLMYTSCGWFFDEVSGIETVQILQYAAKVVQYLEQLPGGFVEQQFVSKLERVPSNLLGNAAQVYEKFVKPARLDLLRVGVHYAVSSLFEDYPRDTGIYCYTVQRIAHDVYEAGKLRLAVGRIRVSSDITWNEEILSYGVLHLGDHNINGGVRVFQGDAAYGEMEQEIRWAFDRADVPEVIRLMDKHFGVNNFSLWHLFRDEQRKVINQILDLAYKDAEISYRRILEANHAIMNFLQDLSAPLPELFTTAAERIINLDVIGLFEREELDVGKLENLIGMAGRWQLKLNRELIGFRASQWLTSAMERLQEDPRMENLDITGAVLRSLKAQNIDLDLWMAQNIYFSMGESMYREMKSGPSAVTEDALNWAAAFEELGNQLRVHIM